MDIIALLVDLISILVERVRSKIPIMVLKRLDLEIEGAFLHYKRHSWAHSFDNKYLHEQEMSKVANEPSEELTIKVLVKNNTGMLLTLIGSSARIRSNEGRYVLCESLEAEKWYDGRYRKIDLVQGLDIENGQSVRLQLAFGISPTFQENCNGILEIKHTYGSSRVKFTAQRVQSNPHDSFPMFGWA